MRHRTKEGFTVLEIGGGIGALQIELLRRLRQPGDEPSQEVWEAFVMTVNGIAAGMRNTG